MMRKEQVTIFISYSHKDEILKEELESHLASLKQTGKISSWHDRKIMAGSDWKDAIDSKLENSDIIILLVSSDFIASEYCYGRELKKALEKHRLGQTTLIPIIIRACHWEGTPFSDLQALPKDGKPVTRWVNRDEAWVDVVVGIENTFKRKMIQRDQNEKPKKDLDIGKTYVVGKKGRITNRKLAYDKLLRANGRQRTLVSVLWPDREKEIIRCGTIHFWWEIGWAPKEGGVGEIRGIMKHFFNNKEIYLMEFKHHQNSVFLAIQASGVELID